MRVYKRINDVYEVELPDCKKYFQFLQSDFANIESSNIYFRNIDWYESIID